MSADLREFERGMADLIGQVPGVSSRALARVAAGILGDAQERTPVDTGVLRGSGRVDTEQDGLPAGEVRIGFTAEYAAAVHEDLEAAHDVGEAKYLERTLEDWAQSGRLVEALAEEVRQEL